MKRYNERVIFGPCENCGTPLTQRRRRFCNHSCKSLAYWGNRTVEERFWEKVDRNGPISEVRPDLGRCWLWTAYRDRLGYGRFMIGPGRPTLAHRFAYMDLIGGDIAGLELDHLCRNPSCLNPGHLEPVSHAENTRRIPDKALRSGQAKKTHCPQGHPYEGHNVIRHGNKRTCRICSHARTAEWKRRRRAQSSLKHP